MDEPDTGRSDLHQLQVLGDEIAAAEKRSDAAHVVLHQRIDKIGRRWWQVLVLLVPIMLSGTAVALVVWADTRELVKAETKHATQERVTSVEARVGNLESGRSTPMAAETRAQFDAVFSRMDKLEAGQQRILDHLLEAGRGNRP